jgi:hypothetical protein
MRRILTIMAGICLVSLLGFYSVSADSTWLGSKIGLTNDVMSPWTALQTNADSTGINVKAWARQYSFTDSVIPCRIVTAGRSILSRPIDLQVVVEGERQRLSGAKVTITRKTPSSVSLSSESQSRVLRLTGKADIHYDGLIWIKLTISPKRALTLDKVTLDIPVKNEIAELYNFWPKAGRSIPPKGIAAPYTGLAWIGWEEGGISWMAESDQHWYNVNKNRAIEVIPGKKETLLRIRMIDQAFSPNQPVTYSFGLQATPVKPIPADRHKKMIHCAFYNMEKMPAAVNLTYPASGNIDPMSGEAVIKCRPEFELNPVINRDTPRWSYCRELFAVVLRNGDVARLYWNVDDRGLRYEVYRNGAPILVINGRKKLERNRYHEIKLSWGEKIEIQIDGSSAGEKSGFKGLFDSEISLGKGRIMLGTHPFDFMSSYCNGGFIVTRLALHAGNGKLLLDDDFSNILQADDSSQTAAGGLLSQGGAFVNTSVGTGVRLYQTDVEISVLDRVAEMGVDTIIFHQNWADIQSYPRASKPELLDNLVKEAHKRNIKILVYFGFEMSDKAPEWDEMAERVLNKPPGQPLGPAGKARWGSRYQLEQNAYRYCSKSEWQDRIVAGIAETMDRYGVDGVYLDAVYVPYPPCTNYLHGCGYWTPGMHWAPEGSSIKGTYPILAARRMAQRIYQVVKSRGGYINANVAWGAALTPVTAYADSYWDGEAWDLIWGANRPKEDNASDILPCDAFCAEFAGRNWGVPAEMLLYKKPPRWMFDTVLPLTLLHDTLIRPEMWWNAYDLGKISRIWSIMDKFGVRHSEWFAYWNKNNPVLLSGERERKVKASIYSRDSSYLVVVSNLGSTDKSVLLSMKNRNLKCRFTDLTDNKEIVSDAAGMMLTIPGQAMKLIQIETEIVSSEGKVAEGHEK